jgi:hypothetical protein
VSRSLLLLALCAVLAACATTGAVRDGDRTEPQPLGEPVTPPPASQPARADLPPVAPDHLLVHDSRTIPGGLACLIRLRELGISYVSLPPLKGVLTPVRLTGLIGGIRYVPLGGKTPLVGDCRLGLVLHRAAPYLQQLGVTELHYSGAYSYRLMQSGRLSQHAMGLAIDVHKVRANGELLDIRYDYTVGMETPCAPESPVLNRMACLLRSWKVFDWVLTPDFDRTHDNHFHLDIYCLHRRRFVPKDAPELAIDD